MELCSPQRTTLPQQFRCSVCTEKVFMSTLAPYLPSRFLSWKLKKLQPCTIQVHHSSARVLVWQQCFRYYVCACVRTAGCQNWWGFRSGTKSPNRQIKTTTKFSHIWYCKDKKLKFGHRKFTVEIRTVPFCFVYTYIMVLRL